MPPTTTEKRQESIASRIRETLAERGMGQADLARAIGVQPTTLWKYLDGQTGIDKKILPIARALGVSAEWLENGGDDHGDPQTKVIESFVLEFGPTLRPPLTAKEAGWARAWPHHQVTHGKLLDAIRSSREGLSPEEAADSSERTDAARKKGAALGVPARRKK